MTKNIRLNFNICIAQLLFCFLFSIHPLQAGESEIEKRVEELLAAPLEDDGIREEAVNELVALGEPACWFMAGELGTRDLFKFFTLREALIQQEATASLALRHYADSLPERRARAAMGVLAKIGNPGDLPFFLSKIEDPRWRMRGAALKGIGNTEVVSVTLEAQIHPRLNDPDVSVRRQATGALGKVGTDASLDGLLKRFSDDSFFVRQTAKRAIVKIWNRNGTGEFDLAPLLELTKQNRSLAAKIPAIELLGNRKEQVAQDRLKKLALDSDWAVRGAAIQALGKHHREWVVAEFSLEKESDPYVKEILEQLAE